MKPIVLMTLALALLGAAGSRLLAQAAHAPDAAHATEAESAHAQPGAHEVASEGTAHPSTSHDAGPVVPPLDHRWPGQLVFVVLVMFFMAAVIGPIVRSQMPPEMPPTHSHDEPPGASHHHGHTGTINPVPEDVAKLEHPHDHDHGHHH